MSFVLQVWRFEHHPVCWLNLTLGAKGLWTILTFNRRRGHHPIKCTYVSSENENNVPQWAFNLNSAVATGRNVEFIKGRTLKVNIILPLVRSAMISFQGLSLKPHMRFCFLTCTPWKDGNSLCYNNH